MKGGNHQTICGEFSDAPKYKGYISLVARKERKMAKTEAYIMNELKVMARMWNISIYEMARWEIEDYFEGEDDAQNWASRLSNEDAIKEYVKLKTAYYNK